MKKTLRLVGVEWCDPELANIVPDVLNRPGFPVLVVCPKANVGVKRYTEVQTCRDCKVGRHRFFFYCRTGMEAGPNKQKKNAARPLKNKYPLHLCGFASAAVYSFAEQPTVCE